MKKLFLTIILSLSLFSLENEVKATREITGIEAFLCATHQRLGANSPARVLPPQLRQDICNLAVEPLEITNNDLQDFNGLIELIRNRFVTVLDLTFANITNEQLACILGAIGGNLRELNLRDCRRLTDFSCIANCPRLQVLDLYNTNITDAQLARILGAIGGNLRELNLSHCGNLRDFSSIANCSRLQVLGLGGPNITDEQLAALLSAIGGTLKELNLKRCSNLTNFSCIANCSRLEVLNLEGDLIRCALITDEQLANILGAIGGSLRVLSLYGRCQSNVKALREWLKTNNLGHIRVDCF